MKKIALLISLIGLFILSSCDTKDPVYEYTNSNQPTTENLTQSVPSDTTLLTNDKTSTTTIEESKKEDDVYNDDIPWGPLH